MEHESTSISVCDMSMNPCSIHNYDDGQTSGFQTHKAFIISLSHADDDGGISFIKHVSNDNNRKKFVESDEKQEKIEREKACFRFWQGQQIIISLLIYLAFLLLGLLWPKDEKKIISYFQLVCLLCSMSGVFAHVERFKHAMPDESKAKWERVEISFMLAFSFVVIGSACIIENYLWILTISPYLLYFVFRLMMVSKPVSETASNALNLNV